MGANPFLGVLLHSIGGLAAASFYVPYKKVKGWNWEVFWLVGGVFSWLIVPWVVALLVVHDPVAILMQAPHKAIMWAFIFGLLWGVGGLTFGLSMRYLGIALGYAVALGFCAAFGTLMPPIIDGTIGKMAASHPGQIVLLGIGVCLVGIAVSGMAGKSKESEMPEAEKLSAIKEFSFAKGMAVAVFSGILSACMAYGIAAAKPIGDLAVAQHVPPLWQNTPTFIVILAGGFVTNFVWCMFLILRNSGKKTSVAAAVKAPAIANLLLCALAGTTWYLQFMFYGMGTTKMGRYNFTSWTLHMSAIIIFSTLWGISLREWKGASVRTHVLVALGLAILIGSMIVVGYGNYLAVH